MESFMNTVEKVLVCPLEKVEEGGQFYLSVKSGTRRRRGSGEERGERREERP